MTAGTSADANDTATPSAPAGDWLAGVVDPWTWPRAAGATDRERAIEDIGPYEPVDRARAGSALVNTNAHYWTALVGIAWDRDVDLDFDREPVDLDGDGIADTRVTRHVHARGGVLANPDLFGLVRTPDDPRGRAGRVSASTGVLGLREALGRDGRPTGQIGMTCFVCHGGVDPRDGHVMLGSPGVAFDYGLLLATAAVLDDRDAKAVEYRRARGFSDGRTVRARLLLAGPGRQDLTGEFGLDVTVPGIHSAHYPGTRRVRQGTVGIVNPISVPGILAAAGVDLQNWSGSEVASARWLRRLVDLDGGPGPATLRRFGLPADSTDDARGAAAARRALLLDLRNLGTLGLQQDSFPGLLWADAIYGRAHVTRDELAAIPPMYGARAVRGVLAAETRALSTAGGRAAVSATSRVPSNAAAVARGRALFTTRFVGSVANQQILKEPPERYAAAKIGGPMLAPIDEALPARFAVRCVDCHSATPGGAPVALGAAAPPFGRCTHCHHAHTGDDGDDAVTEALGDLFDKSTEGARASGAATQGRRAFAAHALAAMSAEAEVARCGRCHERHRPFDPVVYSSSLLLPFDANGNGMAQDDEAADARAGGIGTEALLAFDVPRPERPAGGFAIDMPSLTRLHAIGHVGTARIGAGWVRVAPLVDVRATAPYLHNGSVPTLRALFDPARRRPVTFPLGEAGFTFDTRLSGNHNTGHEFGTTLTPREKSDLVAFLETL